MILNGCNLAYQSKQHQEWSFLLQLHVFVDQHNFFILSIMSDFCPQVIEVVRFSDLIPEIAMYWHGFQLRLQVLIYFQMHGCSRLKVTEFEEACSHVSVIAEKSKEFVLEFRELLLARESCIIFKVVIQDMDSFNLKQCINFRIFMENISQMSFLNVRVNGSISHSSPEHHHWKNRQQFKSNIQVPILIEEQGKGRQYEDLEWILISFASLVVSLEGWQSSVKEILKVGVEGRSNGGGVFRFLDMSWIFSILLICIVCRFPFILPSQVVRVA